MSSDARSLCLLFRAVGERVAIRGSDVQKVTPPGHLSRLPRLPPWVMGITQHRGRVVTVVDIGRVLFPQATPSTTLANTVDARILILERPARHIGLAVDAVLEIEPLALPADLPEGPAPALRLAHHRGKGVAVLDVERLAQQLGILHEREHARR